MLPVIKQLFEDISRSYFVHVAMSLPRFEAFGSGCNRACFERELGTAMFGVLL